MNKHGRDPKTIASFDPTWIEDDDQIVIADRTTLQRWSDCPAQARAVEAGTPDAGKAAAAGTEVHLAISQAIETYIDSGGSITKRQLIDDLLTAARYSRSDVQPMVIESLRYGVWKIAELICRMPPMAIVRFDGGQGEMSGQLSWDLDVGGTMVRVTTELDLLLATESPELLDIWDWKTGRKRWLAADVARSFQFACQGWLVLKNYPEVQTVNVRVLNTLTNQETHVVPIRRDRLKDIEARIWSAAADMLRGRLADTPELRPDPELCAICPAVIVCPVADATFAKIQNDPGGAVDALVAMEAMIARWREMLVKIVDDRGEDLQGSTQCFGRNAPSTRTPSARLYKRPSRSD